MSDHDPKRRTLLRIAAGGGCVLAAPMLFSGCGRNEDSPQPETATVPSSADKPDTSTDNQAITAPEGGKLVSKAEAKYQYQPNNGQKCGNCLQFIAQSNTCKLVEGEISPEGWCTLWTG